MERVLSEKDELSVSSLLNTRDLMSGTAQVALVAREGLYSAAYAAVQQPISAVAEIVDRNAGTDTVRATQMLPESEKTNDLTIAASRHIGATIGSVAPLILLHSATRWSTNRLLGTIDNTVATNAMQIRRGVLDAALTGAVFEGVFRPTINEARDENFLLVRGKNALTGAATFAAMSSAALGLRSIPEGLSKRGSLISPVASLARSEVGSAVLAGVPAGIVNAEMHSVLNKGRHATTSELAISTASFALLGGVLSAGAKFARSTRSDAVPKGLEGATTEPSTVSFLLMRQARPYKNGAVELIPKGDTSTPAPQSRPPLGELSGEAAEAVLRYSELSRFSDTAPQALALRKQYGNDPTFQEYAKEVDTLGRLFNRNAPRPTETEARLQQEAREARSPEQKKTEWEQHLAESPETSKSADALAEYAMLLEEHGAQSKVVEDFARQNAGLKDFTELASDVLRLYLLARQGSSNKPR